MNPPKFLDFMMYGCLAWAIIYMSPTASLVITAIVFIFHIASIGSVKRLEEQLATWRDLAERQGLVIRQMGQAETPLEVIAKYSGVRIDLLRVSTKQKIFRAGRNALVATHPDKNGGDRTAYDRVDQAMQILDLY